MALSPFSLIRTSSTPRPSILSSSPVSSSFSISSQDSLVRVSSTLGLRIFCLRQALDLETESDNPPSKVAVRKKRAPRPSFLQQVQDKWSLKLDSKRDKFPWQLQEEGEEATQPDPQRRESEPVESVTQILQEERFHSGDGYHAAPWISRDKTQKPRLDSAAKASQASNREGENANLSIEFLEDSSVEEGDGSIENLVSALVEKKTFNFRRTKGALSNGNTVEKGNDLHDASKDFVSQEGSQQNLSSGSTRLPWRREQDGKNTKRSNTELAERMVPDFELKRLRNIALRMLERIKVGKAGITENLVESIHNKWNVDEVVKLKFEGPLSVNMKRTHEMLEGRTGGIVIWRSGSSVVLYRGMSYQLRCVQSFNEQIRTGSDREAGSSELEVPCLPDFAKPPEGLSKEELMDIDELLDDLGPRFKDWCGREPVPVDADLLPSVVPNYKTPYRLLPHGVRRCLRDKEMTNFRQLSRTVPPHFALGRNRNLQGLAQAMAKLWERSAIAKIAIKRGVQNTCNDRMAEELKKLTGGTLLSRNKDFIVFYRGNDFLPCAVKESLEERLKLTNLQQNEEEKVRRMASISTSLNSEDSKYSLLAGTLTETLAATSRWANEPNSEDVEEMIRDSSLQKHESLLRSLEKKLVLAKGKVRKAERNIAKLQMNLEPSDLPSDLETVTDEERFLFRKMGLSMKPYLLLGRREVFDGTVENMHLHWKHRELVKLIVRGRSFPQVKHIAISLEAESGGVLISLDKTPKGYAIILYRGKNYQMPGKVRPRNLLTRRQALARSIELQRREALKHHILDLEERIELIKSELEDKSSEKKYQRSGFSYPDMVDETDFEEMDEEEHEGYLEIHSSDKHQGDE
ncbi:hypothetical protein SAY87_008323 [Trapa incisa]|uniref:CRM domain-containing protein n=1 Tax=Trapa incisa TaxID=236973 RepID=A0AAN7QFW7_9MYRT|nr:hypothetical protein SAY87_008323 [Trapa incisa]